jgi:hypothetical protein
MASSRRRPVALPSAPPTTTDILSRLALCSLQPHPVVAVEPPPDLDPNRRPPPPASSTSPAATYAPPSMAGGEQQAPRKPTLTPKP